MSLRAIPVTVLAFIFYNFLVLFSGSPMLAQMALLQPAACSRPNCSRFR